MKKIIIVSVAILILIMGSWKMLAPSFAQIWPRGNLKLQGFVELLREGSVDEVQSYMDRYNLSPDLVFPDNLFGDLLFAADFSRNPLNIAISSGNYDVFSFLVEQGGLIDNRETKLNAISFVHCDLDKLLFIMDMADQYGQQPDFRSSLRCIDDSYKQGNSQLAEFMDKVGDRLIADRQSLIFAFEPDEANLAIVEFIVDKGFLICNEDQRNLADLASSASPQVIAYLLEAGCNPNQSSRTSNRPPISFAIAYNPDLDASRLLLDAGADPNQRDTSRHTALEFLDHIYKYRRPISNGASWQERRQLLLDYGATEYLSRQELQELYKH